MSAPSFRARWRRAPLAAFATIAIAEALAWVGNVYAFASEPTWTHAWWALGSLAMTVFFGDAYAVQAAKVSEVEANEKRIRMTARLLDRLRHPEPESRP